MLERNENTMNKMYLIKKRNGLRVILWNRVADFAIQEEFAWN